MRFLACLTVLVLAAGCGTPKSGGTVAAPAAKHGKNAEFALTAPQISTLSKFAQQGNEDAALKLVNYYEFFAQDERRALYWCEMGAKHGSEICRHNLKVLKGKKRSRWKESKCFRAV